MYAPLSFNIWDGARMGAKDLLCFELVDGRSNFVRTRSLRELTLGAERLRNET